ncbi:MAG: hypothetical protein SFY80_07560 [Verrucomicrobiota bacterium]|nr:hypothetical protein [Verrucomicrobiota bacterium]
MFASVLRFGILSVVILAAPGMVHAGMSAADVVKAQQILEQVVKITTKYQAKNIVLEAPTPITGNTGKYLLPVDANGQLTPWATKSLAAQIGAVVGEKATEVATKQVTGHIPFGGLLNGVAKDKGKEIGAITAIGGMEFIKSNSTLSFDNLDDYAVYLHANGVGSDGLAAAMAIYPSLAKKYDDSIGAAYKMAAKGNQTASK